MPSIPLRAADGSVRAYARVDAADFDALNRWRWHLTNKGYAARKTRNRRAGTQTRHFMHRQLLGLAANDRREGDHKNGNRLDNRRSNLRISRDGYDNAQNRRMSRRNSSGFRGVTWDKRKGRWMATAMVGRRRHFLGYHDTAEHAGAAAAGFRALHMPFSEEAA